MTPTNPHNPYKPTAPDQSPPQKQAPKPGLMRSIGQFAGHLFTSVKHNPTAHQVSKVVEEQATTDEQGRSVTLRRTTIEEVEIKE